MTGASTVVRVHGASANGSSWSKVLPQMTTNGVIENFAQDPPLRNRQMLDATQAPKNGAASGASHYRRVALERHLECGGQQRSHDPARARGALREGHEREGTHAAHEPRPNALASIGSGAGDHRCRKECVGPLGDCDGRI